MSEHFEVEPLGDHEYLLRARVGEEVVESRFRASETVAEQLHVESTDERRVVEETAEFLAERQPLVDLPPMVDLDDVVACYDDYLDQLEQRLASSYTP
ncbi:hypothetical protein [Streptomyces sp. FH025]|uniref:hypothetical protein n=1 Tax=Streptomyces sp. FH025 TaxID=2815937 RepID=UPI001A9DE8A2|nr:hypothetical protein [Streptomyces sp. FH025]MBO1414562.1 hypothetical protein [Streptomyces sp. FH025]